MNTQATDTSRLLGPWMCTALVVGNMIGSGIFFLPASLAPYGLGNATSAWLFTASGAVLLACVFAGLSRGLPGAAGPYAYTRMAFGELPAFLIAWGYWISVWTGNAAIATGGVAYLSNLFPAIGAPGVAPIVSLSVIWLLTGVNVLGARTAGGVQVATTVMKLIPLFIVAGVGLYLLLRGDARIAVAVHASAPVTLGAFTAAATLTLWPLLGFESANVATARVRDASRVIPRATIMGAGLAAVVYIIASSAVQILIPADELAKSTAPFADVVRIFFGDAVGRWIALFAVISAFGAERLDPAAGRSAVPARARWRVSAFLCGRIALPHAGARVVPVERAGHRARHVELRQGPGRGLQFRPADFLVLHSRAVFRLRARGAAAAAHRPLAGRQRSDRRAGRLRAARRRLRAVGDRRRRDQH